MLTRRGLITGLISFVAAPAIVRVSSIMPVRPVKHIWAVSPEFVAPSTEQLLQAVFDHYRMGISPTAVGKWGMVGDRVTFTPISPDDLWLKPQAQRDAGNRQGDQE
jgi:hypothetical protein